jgi:pyruvate ferredoxin oxidoreductase beta subunit
MEDGQIKTIRKIKEKIPVESYLKPQKRFRHLFAAKEESEALKQIQALADRNIEKFNLLN